MYHRVIDLPSDPQLLTVRPQHFAEHLEVIRERFQPESLAELAPGLRMGRIRDRAIVLTFDDGYADNFQNAMPLLEHYQIPATIFVVSDQIGTNTEFWWDELEKLVLLPGNLPDCLQLDTEDGIWKWDVNGNANNSGADSGKDLDWHVERPDDPGPRQRLYRSLYHMLYRHPQQQRTALLRQLRSWAGVDSNVRPTYRSVTPEELIILDRSGAIEIGAHTASHAVLGSLPRSDQFREINQGKRALEEILEHPVRSFSYPHGSYTDETRDIVRDLGFSCAGSSRHDLVWPGSDVLELPRIVVRDWDGDTFAQKLQDWVRG